LAKVGAHAACVAILILSLPDWLVWREADLAIPTFTENVKVGQPPSLGRLHS
jgi:hypothetical protein